MRARQAVNGAKSAVDLGLVVAKASFSIATVEGTAIAIVAILGCAGAQAADAQVAAGAQIVVVAGFSLVGGVEAAHFGNAVVFSTWVVVVARDRVALAPASDAMVFFRAQVGVVARVDGV